MKPRIHQGNDTVWSTCVRIGLRTISGWGIVWLMIAAGLAWGQTVVPPGALTADVTWTRAGSPYTLSGDVSIESGATLRLEPGTVVHLGDGVNLIVQNGALNASGLADDPIVLTSPFDIANSSQSPAPGDWGQLQFLPGTRAATTLLQNVQIKYGSGIDVQGAAPVFNHLRILQNAGPAIQLDLAASPSGRGLSASGNVLNGIKIPAGTITKNVRWGLWWGFLISSKKASSRSVWRPCNSCLRCSISPRMRQDKYKSF
ncbi:MAG TPA: hypothetical protein PK018_01565 [Candidatus Competibacter sp.]|nr:hypothetical protein [Candidatus Competibacteraceae bacterium]HPE70848.1 hypothetical protein [Candidatus Competibacter sp.]HRW65210.1 hypothetical protein [Candidatus Competibacter sp.]